MNFNRFLKVFLGTIPFILDLKLYSQLNDPTPKVNQVNIKNIKVNGTGCPINSTTEILANKDKNAPFNYFQVTYDEFVVTRGPDTKPSDSRKFCNIVLDLHYPDGWQYTMVDLQTSGYAEIAKGAKGTLKGDYQFRHTKLIKTVLTEFQEGFVDEYDINSKIEGKDNVIIWSQCDLRIPLNLKTTINLTGSRKEESSLGLDIQSGVLTQKYKVNWKRCS